MCAPSTLASVMSFLPSDWGWRNAAGADSLVARRTHAHSAQHSRLHGKRLPAMGLAPEVSAGVGGWARKLDDRGRLLAAYRGVWGSASSRVMVGLIVVGIALRVLAIVSWWPVAPTLEDGYQRFAANPFLDPQHPAGYDLIVAALGHVSRQIAFTVLLQHVIGIVSALLLAAAVRRITGSAWAGLVPAAIVLLDPDQIFLEHAIMSESWAILAIALSFYGVVRSCEEPERWWRWPLGTGIALAAAVMIRTASLPMIAIFALALVLYQARPFRRWREHLRASAVMVCTAAIGLLAFAGASAASGQRFGIAPSPGWYLYGRVAQFADCHKFVPPPGTAALCQNTPQSRRPAAYYYTFESGSPAVRVFGAFGRDDATVGSWARAALLPQFGDFLGTAWTYLRSYYVPGSLPARLKATSTGLDPQLDFTNRGNPIVVSAMKVDLETYYDRYTVHPIRWGLQFLHDWQRVVRFGATALFVTTVLSLIGLLVGDRRSRVGVLLFGLGGLSLLLAPVLTGTYSGRYTVPMAGLLAGAAAITITELARRGALRWRYRRPDPGRG